jgi:hypothetical protein
MENTENEVIDNPQADWLENSRSHLLQTKEDKDFLEFEAQIARQRQQDSIKANEKKKQKKRKRKEKKEKEKKRKKREKETESRNDKAKSSETSSTDTKNNEGSKEDTTNATTDSTNTVIKEIPEDQKEKIHSENTKESEELLDQNVPLPPSSSLQRDEWMLAPPKREKISSATSLPNISSVSSSEKDEDKPRELNPFLSPNSNISEKVNPSEYLVGDGGRSWRQRALRRQAERERETKTSTDNKRTPTSSFSSGSETPTLRDKVKSSPLSSSRRGWRKDVRTKGPVDTSHSTPSHSSDVDTSNIEKEKQRNTMQNDEGKSVPGDNSAHVISQPPHSDNSLAKDSAITDDNNNSNVARTMLLEDPNKMAAQMMKAQLRGDIETANKIQRQLEQLRQTQRHFQTTDKDQKKNQHETEVVIISDIDERGRSRSQTVEKNIAAAASSPSASKPHKGVKVQTHTTTGERIRYFADDDVSLKELVEREKRSGPVDYDAQYAENVIKSSKWHASINKIPNAETEYDDDEYEMWGGKQSRQSRQKQQARERQKAINETKKWDKQLAECFYCFENRKVPKHLVMALGEYTYLMLAERPILRDQCLIVPLQHEIACTMIEDNVWEEIRNFMSCLVKMWQSLGKGAIFMETVLQVKKKRHTVLECYGIEEQRAAQAPAYFQKAIMESESEWTQHKKLIDTSAKGLRRSIPPHFSYFYVQFGLQKGFAHVIEDHTKFPHFFGREIVAGILEMKPEDYLHPKKQTLEEELKRAREFTETWKLFDWTQQLEGGEY